MSDPIIVTVNTYPHVVALYSGNQIATAGPSVSDITSLGWFYGTQSEVDSLPAELKVSREQWLSTRTGYYVFYVVDAVSASPSANVSVAGKNATVSTGAVSVSAVRVSSVGVNGITASTYTGTVIVSNATNLTAAVNSTLAAASTGSVNATADKSVTLNISGVSSTAAYGSVNSYGTVGGQAIIPVSGTIASVNTGNVGVTGGASTSVSIIGVLATGASGNVLIVPTQNKTVAVTGVGTTGSTGTVVVSVPAAIPPAPVIYVNGGDSSNTITWASVSGATSYNLYWTSDGSTPTKSSTKITGATAPYVHSGLSNGVTYKYVATSVNASGESTTVSAVVSGTPSVQPYTFSYDASQAKIKVVNGSNTSYLTTTQTDYGWFADWAAPATGSATVTLLGAGGGIGGDDGEGSGNPGGTGGYTALSTSVANITNITKNISNTPITANNSFQNGDVVLINNVTGMDQANNRTGLVANATSTSFSINWNSSSASSYVSSGFVSRLMAVAFGGLGGNGGGGAGYGGDKVLNSALALSSGQNYRISIGKGGYEGAPSGSGTNYVFSTVGQISSSTGGTVTSHGANNGGSANNGGNGSITIQF